MTESNHDRVQALIAYLRLNQGAGPTGCLASDYISCLYDGFLAEATCTCCDEEDVCDDECTFADDCPDEAERMEYVREVLRLPG